MTDSVNTRADELVCAVADALEAAGRKVATSYVAFGDVAWDKCCDGLLYVRLLRMYPTDRFPQEQFTPTTCAVPLAAQFEVVVARCAPAPRQGQRGVALPKPEAIAEAAVASQADAQVMAQAVQALAADWWDGPDARSTVIGSWTPIGPAGGCQGGALQVTIEL